MDNNPFDKAFAGGEIGRRLFEQVSKGHVIGVRVFNNANDRVDFVVYVPVKYKDKVLDMIRWETRKCLIKDGTVLVTVGFFARVVRDLSFFVKDFGRCRAYYIFAKFEFDSDEDYERLPYSEVIEF